jgi:hypothetical protein
MSKDSKNNPPQLAGVIDNILKTETYENAMKILAAMPRPMVVPTIEAETASRHARCILDTAKTVAPLAVAQGMDQETMLLVVLSTMIADCIQAAEASGICPKRLAEHAHVILCSQSGGADEDDESAGPVFPTGLFGTSADEGLN